MRKKKDLEVEEVLRSMRGFERKLHWKTMLKNMMNINYLLTESEVMPGNIKLRLERIDRAIARLIRQSRGSQLSFTIQTILKTSTATNTLGAFDMTSLHAALQLAAGG